MMQLLHECMTTMYDYAVTGCTLPRGAQLNHEAPVPWQHATAASRLTGRTGVFADDT